VTLVQVARKEFAVAIRLVAALCLGIPVVFGLIAFVIWLFSSGGRKED